MAVLKFMMGNLKKRKLYSAVICILVFLTGFILMVTVSAARNTGYAYDRAYENIDGPHLMYWMEEDSYRDEFMEWFERQPEVESVNLRIQRDFKGAFLQHKDITIKNNTVCRMLTYEPSDNMRIINGIYSAERTLSKGEIYLPYVYMGVNGLSVGDEVDYVYDTKDMHFVIAGFVEDPVYGGELIGGKFLFISSDDMAELEKSAAVSRNLQMRIRLNDYSASDTYIINKKFVEENNFDAFTLSNYDAIKSWHLSLPNISLVVMIVFAFILSVITITIMRYAILSTIEADFTNIGIVKALGFTPFMVQIAICSQYGLLAIISGILSLLFSLYISPFAVKVILKSSGLYYSSQFSIVSGIFIIFAIVFVISIFSYMISGRARKISPVRAITLGIAPLCFSLRLNLSLSKMSFLPFDLSMAAKQVLTKAKRYTLLIIISALLVYTMVFLLGLVQMFNSERAINMLGGELSDIRVSAETKTRLDNLFSVIKQDYEVEWTTYQCTVQLNIDDVKTVARIKDDFDATGELSTLKGQHPKRENEAAISVLLKKSLGKDIGEYISIKDNNGQEHQFVITGIFQTIDEGGSYVRLLETGMKLLDPSYELNMGYIKLMSRENLDDIINEMKTKYSGYTEISNERKQTDEKLNTIRTVFSALSKLVFIFTIVIISFIILLIMKITVYSETRELGIFKALGFNSTRIRLQLVLRFLTVTIAGGIIGAICEVLWGTQLFTIALRGLGISSFKLEFSLMNATIPIIMISLLATLSAYFSSGHIKKVSVFSLINE